MIDEVGKALGPWPILQFVFGLAVLCFGAIAIFKGLSSEKKSDAMEDKRIEWEAMERLRSIDENTQKIADNQRAMLENVRGATDQIRGLTEQMKALAAAIWNRGV
jgi:hypothetical protein